MLTPEITVILFTRGLACAQCTNNCLTCENDTANYKILQEHQLNSRRFPGAISNSRRVSGVGDTLYNDLVLLRYQCQDQRCQSLELQSQSFINSPSGNSDFSRTQHIKLPPFHQQKKEVHQNVLMHTFHVVTQAGHGE